MFCICDIFILFMFFRTVFYICNKYTFFLYSFMIDQYWAYVGYIGYIGYFIYAIFKIMRYFQNTRRNQPSGQELRVLQKNLQQQQQNLGGGVQIQTPQVPAEDIMYDDVAV